jgi:hypothetical protein
MAPTFGEAALWVECDLCGRAFGGPGLSKAIVPVGHVNICVDCLRMSKSKWGISAEGVGCPAGSRVSHVETGDKPLRLLALRGACVRLEKQIR